MPFSLLFCLLLAVGLTAGIHADIAFAAFTASLLAACLGGAWLARHLGLAALPEALTGCALVAAAVLHGMHAVDRAEHSALRRWFDARSGEGEADPRGRRDEPVLVRGWLTRDAAVTESGASLQVAVSHLSVGGAWEPVEGGLSVAIGGVLAGPAAGEWRAGRLVEFPATLRTAARYLNIGVPDAERALARRGTALVGAVKSGALVEIRARGRWWDEGAASLRAAVRSAMTRHVGRHDAVAAAIGTAILIGDRAQMTREVEQRLQEAGTYHVVAISGGNIALLAAAVLAVLWALRLRFAAGAVLALTVLAVHAWIIGGGPSVMRATVMAITYLALRAIDQRTAPVNAVAVGASLMLIANPLDIVSAGFWLTFGATAALLAAGAAWNAARPSSWWHAAAAICLGSLAVELVLMPVSALVFERVTIAGLVLNLAAVPAMGVVQAAASACVMADALGAATPADLFGWVTYGAARVLVDSSELVDFAPWATWRVPAPSLWLMAAYYTALVAWWLGRSVASRRVAATRGCAPVAAALWLWIAVAPHTYARTAFDTRMRVTAMDVGQGDASLVTFPDGQTLLVDAGGVSTRGGFDIGDRILGPALRARGLGRLDYVAVTHGDPDHIGGAMAVVRDFGPAEVWMGVPVAGHEPEAVLAAAARDRRSAVRWLQRGDRIRIGEVDLLVHHPPLPDWERQRVRNDDSLVLELRYRRVSVLLTGDISRSIEAGLVETMDLLPRVVLKAPHHGSGTSSSAAFLRHLRPEAVLVSAGRGNLYGHPTPEVLARYGEVGAQVFRTDRDGQVELVTDGETLEVQTFTGLRWRSKVTRDARR
jgi:competence protein ComEC